MKYLLLMIMLITSSVLYAQPSYPIMVNVTETSATFEFDLTDSYLEAGICWNSTGTPTRIVSDTVKIDSPSAGTYQVTATGLSSSTIYYVRAYTYDGPGLNDTKYSKPYTITKAIWVGKSSSWTATTNWEDNRNWETSDIIIIPDAANDPVITSNSSVAGKILMKDGSNLTINTGVTLSVSGDLVIKGASGSSGIICDGTLSVSGTSNYERYIDAADWHLLSSPNSNSDITQHPPIGVF